MSRVTLENIYWECDWCKDIRHPDRFHWRLAGPGEAQRPDGWVEVGNNYWLCPSCMAVRVKALESARELCRTKPWPATPAMPEPSIPADEDLFPQGDG